MSEETGLELIEFEGFNIRRTWDDETERWWFAVVDVVNALTDSKDPSKYWYDMKRREKDVELSAICRKFKNESAQRPSLSNRMCRYRRYAADHPIYPLP